jgi:hypothetical protein
MTGRAIFREATVLTPRMLLHISHCHQSAPNAGSMWSSPGRLKFGRRERALSDSLVTLAEKTQG